MKGLKAGWGCLVNLVGNVDVWHVFVVQAEDGIRDLVRSRGLGDVYKRQVLISSLCPAEVITTGNPRTVFPKTGRATSIPSCLLSTSDAADELLCVDLGGRSIMKKKKQNKQSD